MTSKDAITHDSDPFEVALSGLFDRHPNAVVAGFDETMALVPVQEWIASLGKATFDTAHLLDVVHAEDRDDVLQAWQRLRAGDKQATQAQVKLADGSSGGLQLIDARAADGLYLAIFLPTKVLRTRTIWRQDEMGIVVDVDARTPDLLGWDRVEIVGRRSLELIHPDDQSEAVQHFINMRAKAGAAAPIRLRHLCRDGSWRWLEVFSENLLEDPAVGSIRSTRIDVQAEMQDEAPEGDEAPPATPRFMRWRQNELGVIRDVDAATSQLLGYTAAELVGRRSLEIIHPDDHEAVIANWMEMLVTPGLIRQTRSRHLRKDGSWLWVETTNHNLLLDPAHSCVHAEKADISKEMAAYEALQAREQLLHRLAESLPHGVIQIDADQRVVYANARLAQVVGVAAAATLPEQLTNLLDEDRARLDDAADQLLRTGSDHDLELRLRIPRDGAVRRIQVSMRALTASAGDVTGAILSVLDVTDSVALREELRDRATYDTLTRCYNRAAVLAELEETVCGPASRAQQGAGLAVVFVDLDLFKSINDRLGHAAGDELLTVAARRLRGALRENDVIGRLGGDEFLVICPDVDDPSSALELAERLACALRGRVDLVAGTVPTRASVGVAWQASAEADCGTLVQQADQAMYESKRRRRGRAVLHNAEVLAASEVVEQRRASV